MLAMGPVLTESLLSDVCTLNVAAAAGRLQLKLRCQATCDANTSVISGLLTQQQILRI